MVTRFNITPAPDGITESENGQWVRYRDHSDMCARLAGVTIDSVREIQQRAERAEAERDTCAAELERLREAIRSLASEPTADSTSGR